MYRWPRNVIEKTAKTIIYMPTFNRKAISLESIANMRAVKGAAHLHILDDASSEFDGRELVALGDSGQVNTSNQGIDANRMHMLVEFYSSEFEYCYFTDSDTLHDVDFLPRLFLMQQKTNCMCGLYNTTVAHVHKDGFNIDVGDDIIVRPTIPGISMFFDKSIALRLLQYFLDAVRFRPNIIQQNRAWDWFFCKILPHVAMSQISYVEHMYAGGMHDRGTRDLGANLTPWLAAERGKIFTRLGIPH
jgi:hypothetical protein